MIPPSAASPPPTEAPVVTTATGLGAQQYAHSHAVANRLKQFTTGEYPCAILRVNQCPCDARLSILHLILIDIKVVTVVNVRVVD